MKASGLRQSVYFARGVGEAGGGGGGGGRGGG